MTRLQYVATTYPDETGGLFRRNGRVVPRKWAAYSEETGGWAKTPSHGGFPVGLFRGNGRTLGDVPIRTA
jgi:hypothetical protein